MINKVYLEDQALFELAFKIAGELGQQTAAADILSVFHLIRLANLSRY